MLVPQTTALHAHPPSSSARTPVPVRNANPFHTKSYKYFTLRVSRTLIVNCGGGGAMLSARTRTHAYTHTHNDFCVNILSAHKSRGVRHKSPGGLLLATHRAAAAKAATAAQHERMNHTNKSPPI